MNVQMTVPGWTLFIPLAILGVVLYSAVGGYAYNKVRRKTYPVEGVERPCEPKDMLPWFAAFFWPVLGATLVTGYICYQSGRLPWKAVSYPGRKVHEKLSKKV